MQAWVWRKDKGGTAWEKGYGIIIVLSIVVAGISIVAIVAVFHSADVDIPAKVVTPSGVVAALLPLLRLVLPLIVIVVHVHVVMLM